jgi:hypothetical protein
MKRLAMLLIAGVGLRTPVLAADGILDARVTIDYRNTPGTDVIAALAHGAGLSVQVDPGVLQPVTITLTNVKLSNALNAVCDNALCAWRLDGGLHITPLPNEKSASLPARLSVDLRGATVADVFRALAMALGVPMVIEPGMQRDQTMNVSFTNASTIDVLNALCNVQHCEWDFDAARGILRFTQKP